MKYEIRSPVATAVVELIRVAAAMASAEAMLLVDAKSGETVLHRSTYEGRFNDIIDLLLTEAYKGRLRVCDNDGRECTMDALVSEGLGITCQALSYDSFQKVATVVFTRPDWLTEWRHDEFVVQQVPPAAWCKQGFVGEGILGAPVRTGTPPAFEHEPATAEVVAAVMPSGATGAYEPVAAAASRLALLSAASQGEPVPAVLRKQFRDALPADAVERRKELLRQFRELDGKLRTEKGKKGRRGAMADLERASGIDSKNLSKMLEDAIAEKNTAERWEQLYRR